MNKLISFVAIPFLCGLASVAFAQTSASSTKAIIESAHLVGHEDELLLRRIEDAIAEWDPRQLDSPYLKKVSTATGESYALRRPDLAEFIADPDAAVALGKALFWEMQAGSDYGQKSVDGKTLGTACASCHYRFGADARSRNTEAIAYQAWEEFLGPRKLVPNTRPNVREKVPPFSQLSHQFKPVGDKDIAVDKYRLADRDDQGVRQPLNGLLPHEIVGSQGVKRLQFVGMDSLSGIESGDQIGRPTWGPLEFNMFSVQSHPTRQVTRRNSPSVINAAFNDRQFHDGRAESTFNGFSIFGDFDKRLVLKKAFLDQSGNASSYASVSVAIVKASLASQAVGPVVNEVEMSFQGRNFHDLAIKLLGKQPLAVQKVEESDSVLGDYSKSGMVGLYDPLDKSKTLTYRSLIQRAFRKEWWADEIGLTKQPARTERITKARDLVTRLCDELTDQHSKLEKSVKDILGNPSLHFPAEAISIEVAEHVQSLSSYSELATLIAAVEAWTLIEDEVLPLRVSASQSTAARKRRLATDEQLASLLTGGPTGLVAHDDLMVNNFSLYWGLSIALYESTLISNQSPFDEMLRGNPSGVQKVWDTLVKDNEVVQANGAQQAIPSEPENDDLIRKVHLDKHVSRNAPPILNGTAMFQRGLRVFVLNCAECHEPPFFTSAADLELAPELPEPVAKLHAHSLVSAALADAMKIRLIDAQQPIGEGVNDGNRNLLGDRLFFFDDERIPYIEGVVADLLIESMGIDDKRPLAFTPQVVLPGQPFPSRVPMITWTGTRPPLGFLASTRPINGKPVDPYAFYDLGFYNLGVSEPRYDWGVWSFTGSDHALSVKEVQAAVKLLQSQLSKFAIKEVGVKALLDQLKEPPLEGPIAVDVKLESLPSLGSAYEFPKSRRVINIQQDKERLSKITRALQVATRVEEGLASEGDVKVEEAIDHSTDRNFYGDAANTARQDQHFFKRARRMVMSEESWGHRKPFIGDSELMGWGAFKAPSLRNVSLTEPYMHNGRFLTLRQVLSFYSFDNPDLIPADVQFNPDLHPEMGRLALNSDGLIHGFKDAPINITQIQDAESLLFFLHCLTDPRVETEQAPFDHPSITVPNGFEGDDPHKETCFTVSEVGKNGVQLPARSPQFPANQ